MPFVLQSATLVLTTISVCLMSALAALAESQAEAEPVFTPLPPLSADWTPLTQKESLEKVWINPKLKQVAVDGEVCLTRGYLELFACVANTKEHESVVSLKSKAQLLHTALLAVGAKSGSPSTWRPTYKPASGTTVEVFVEWMPKEGKGKPKRARAQEWVRDLKTKKPMAHNWVFAGSSTWQDPETKKVYYRADGGEAICVSNFPVAMMDIPIKSTDSDAELAFEAFTENIPARRTPVRVYLIPKPDPKAKKPAKQS